MACHGLLFFVFMLARVNMAEAHDSSPARTYRTSARTSYTTRPAVRVAAATAPGPQREKLDTNPTCSTKPQPYRTKQSSKRLDKSNKYYKNPKYHTRTNANQVL